MLFKSKEKKNFGISMRRRITLNAGILCFILLLIIPFAVSSSPPTITLISPENGTNFTTTNNITFVITVTDDENLKNITLYHNISGEFKENLTKNFGEFEKDDNTLLLCHFNENYTCVDGEVGVNLSTSFAPGKFLEGVLINNSDNLTYSTNGNFNKSQGTIEFWVQLTANASDITDEAHFFTIGDPADPNYANMFDIYLTFDWSLWIPYIYFSVTDYTGSSKYVRQSVSSWKAGEWHHIIAIWDLDNNVTPLGSRLELFLNGSNKGNQHYYDTSDIYQDSTPPYIFIGSWVDSTLQANSVIDELRISDKIRNASEINQSYYNGIKTYTNETIRWTIENIPDGNYIWNAITYDNESNFDWGNTNYSFTVDITPPTITNVTIAPNTSDDIDPGVTINITANVSDRHGVGTVLLQWKETGDWNNVTMTNIGGNGYNASFDIDSTGGVYYYRIWANDTFGNSNYSSTKNITAEWDYTWLRTPSDLGTVNGSIYSEKSIGVFTIENTGDDILSFQLSSDWPWDISYNITSPFTLGAKESVSINVTIKFADRDEEREMKINITASHGTETPSPTSAVVNATIITYSGGPFLVLDITEYSASVSQSQIFNLTARLKNLGNESATNTWINWTLASGWENITGNINYSIGDVNSGKTVFSILTTTVDANSGAPGIYTINVSASCAQGVNASDSVVIAVSCNDSDNICGYGCTYLTDDDCSPPSRGGGGGRAPAPPPIKIIEVPPPTYSPTLLQRKLLLQSLESFEIVRGQTSSFIINVTNPFPNSTLENITILIEGFIEGYLEVNPVPEEKLGIMLATDEAVTIPYNHTRSFEVVVTAPTYAEKGEYPLNITILGKVVYIDYPVTINETSGAPITTKNFTLDMIETKVIRLFVHAVSREDALTGISKGETAVRYLENAGLPIKRVTRLIEEARNALAQGDYERAKELGDEIERIKDTAFSTKEKIEELKRKVAEAESDKGLKVIKTKELIDLAIAAFEREAYSTAFERVQEAELVYSLETKGKVNYAKFFLDYWWAIFMAVGIILAGGAIGYNRYLTSVISTRIEEIDLKEKAIIDHMVEAQEKYYLDRIMSRSEYEDTMNEYRRRLADLKRKRTQLKTERARLLTPKKTLEDLIREEKMLHDMIKDIQTQYYMMKAMGPEEYREILEGLTMRRAEVEEEIALMEAKVAKEERSKR